MPHLGGIFFDNLLGLTTVAFVAHSWVSEIDVFYINRIVLYAKLGYHVAKKLHFWNEEFTFFRVQFNTSFLEGVKHFFDKFKMFLEAFIFHQENVVDENDHFLKF